MMSEFYVLFGIFTHRGYIKKHSKKDMSLKIWKIIITGNTCETLLPIIPHQRVAMFILSVALFDIMKNIVGKLFYDVTCNQINIVIL